MDDFLFVYGTLKQSENHLAHSLLTGDSVYYGQGYFHGKLYQVTTYPAAVLSNGTERVYGEVYRILRPTALFKRLDDYEECNNHYPEPHEYQRSQVTIHLNYETITAWTYLYNLNPIGLDQILSGVYETKRKRD